ncbi:MAG: hypothetical protein WCY11_10210 [Novosphingobium sp.]
MDIRAIALPDRCRFTAGLSLPLAACRAVGLIIEGRQANLAA